LLRARKFIIFGLAILMGLLTVAHHYLMPSYQATVTLLVERAENSPLQAMMGKMTGGNFLSNKTNEYQGKYLAYLESHAFSVEAARLMMQKPELAEDRRRMTTKGALSKILGPLVYSRIDDLPEDEREVEVLARALKGKGSFSKGGFDNIRLEVRSGDYKQAVRLGNFLAEAATNIIVERELTDLTRAKEFIEQQLSVSDQKVQDYDSAIVAFRKNSKYFASDSITSQALGRINSLKNQSEASKLKVEQNEKLIALLTQELNQDKTELLSTGARNLRSSDVINELLQKIQALRYKRVLIQAQGEELNSPQILSLDQSIDTLAQQLKEETNRGGGTSNDADTLLRDKEGLVDKIHRLKRENQYYSTRIQAFSKALGESMAPLNALPEAIQKLTGYNRGTALEYSMFTEMKKKLLELAVEQISLKSKIRISERATVAAIPPRFNIIPKFIMAFLLTSLIAGVFAYGLESMDTTVKNRLDLDELQLVNLGSVPQIKGGFWDELRAALQGLLPERWRSSRNINVLGAWAGSSDAPEIMAFNHIRARIFKMRDYQGKPAKVVAVTSSRPGEGKSYLASNIALSLAHFDKRVLLLDCDLRRTSLPEKLGVSNEIGLSSILTEGKTFDSCVIRNLVPGLDVLTAGRSTKRPTENISGAGFSQLIESLKAKYDYVVIDTPPVLPVVDSLVVASLSDGVILTATYRQTKWKHLSAAVEKLRQMDQQVIYSVLNKVPEVHEYIYIAAPQKRAAAASGATASANGVSPAAPSPGPSAEVSSKIDILAGIQNFKNSIKQEEI
jgi:capsular exopolysaccharide synthesis family protein